MTVTVRKTFRLAVLWAVIACLLLTTAGPVRAGTMIVVTTTDDLGGTNTASKCSLREAVIAANENRAYGGCPAGGTGTDTIYLPASPVKYVLNTPGFGENNSYTGDLDIRSSMVITGAGADYTTVDATDKDRIFDIRSTGPVTISNMSITNGYNIDAGGGALVYMSTVTFAGLNIYDNTPSIAGGGVYITNGSTVVITNTVIANNTAGTGSAVHSEGTLTISNSFIHKNHTTGTAAMGAVTLNPWYGEPAVMINTTIAENSAPTSTHVAGVSVTKTGRLDMQNVTLIDNDGIGLEVLEDGILTLSNTIVARQKENRSDCRIDPGAVFTSYGYNIASDATCNFGGAGDQIVADGDLYIDTVPLFNGGNTPTYALLAEPVVSPAIDTGDDSRCPPSDQRQFGRPGDGDGDGNARCDIGAYEVGGKSFPLYLPLVRR